MKFQFDPSKSESNKLKHGIDFEESRLLWQDPNRRIVVARFQGEVRFLIIGSISKQVWTGMFAIRAGVIRIISVRKSRKNEKQQYFGRGI